MAILYPPFSILDYGSVTMKVEILTDTNAVASKAAEIIAAEARAAVTARGCFVMAVRGGHTAVQMLRGLGKGGAPWKTGPGAKVGWRVARAGDTDGCLAHLRGSLPGPDAIP